MINIPIFRAKKIDSDEYIEGFLFNYDNKLSIQTRETPNYIVSSYIDSSTLAIHFPNMVGSNNQKVFASIGEKGGDIVEGMCRDCNGDTLQALHKPVSFTGVVRFYGETSMSVVVDVQDEIFIPIRGGTPMVIKRGEDLRWSDCRNNIKVVGIQQ